MTMQRYDLVLKNSQNILISIQMISGMKFTENRLGAVKTIFSRNVMEEIEGNVNMLAPVARVREEEFSEHLQNTCENGF